MKVAFLKYVRTNTATGLKVYGYALVETTERAWWDSEHCDHCQYFSPGAKTLVDFPEDKIMLCEVCADIWEEG